MFLLFFGLNILGTVLSWLFGSGVVFYSY
jgi:hypothetical protein